MPPLPQPNIGEILFMAGNFIYMIWFLVIVMALAARRHGLANALTMWIFELFVLIFITFYASSEPGVIQAMRLIQEPLNTYLFFLAGLLLWGAYFIRRQRRSSRRI